MAARNPIEVYEEEILEELLEKGKIPSRVFTETKDIRREAQLELFWKKDIRRLISSDGTTYLVFTDKGRERTIKLVNERATEEVMES